MIRKLSHFCLVTDQLDAMKDFYSRGLGFPVQFAFKNKDGEIFGYYLFCGDSTFIEIFDRVLKHKQWGGNSTIEPLAKGNRKDHFCFEAVGLPALKTMLEGRGVKIGNMKKEMDHSFQMWTADPDGNKIEIMEYTHESWQLRGAD